MNLKKELKFLIRVSILTASAFAGLVTQAETPSDLQSAGISSLEDFDGMKGQVPRFSCAELRAATVIPRSMMPEFQKIMKLKPEDREKAFQSDEAQKYNYTKSGIRFTSQDGAYEYISQNQSEITLRDRYYILLRYFKQNPYGVPEYDGDPYSTLQKIDFLKLMDKEDAIIGPPGHPKLYTYTPKVPDFRSTVPPSSLLARDGAYHATFTTFNFQHGRTMDWMTKNFGDDQQFNKALNEKYPGDRNASKRYDTAQDRWNLTNGDVVAGQELDCSVPAAQFRMHEMLDSYKKLGTSESGKNSEEFSKLNDYLNTYRQVSAFRRQKGFQIGYNVDGAYEGLDRFEDKLIEGISGVSLPPVPSLSAQNFDNTVARLHDLEKWADSRYPSSCKPIDYANRYHYNVAWAPDQFVERMDDVDFMEERNSCSHYTPSGGIANFSKFHQFSKAIALPDVYDSHDDELANFAIDRAMGKLGPSILLNEPYNHDVSETHRVAIISKIDAPVNTYVVSTHLTSDTNSDGRAMQAREIANAIKHIREEDPKAHIMVLGDFNTNNRDGSRVTAKNLIEDQLKGMVCIPAKGMGSNLQYDIASCVWTWAGNVIGNTSLVPAATKTAFGYAGYAVGFGETQDLNHNPQDGPDKAVLDEFAKAGVVSYKHDGPGLGGYDPTVLIPFVSQIQPFKWVLGPTQNIPGVGRLFMQAPERTLESSNKRNKNGFMATCSDGNRDPFGIKELNIAELTDSAVCDLALPKNISTNDPRVGRNLIKMYQGNSTPGPYNYEPDQLSDHYPKSTVGTIPGEKSEMSQEFTDPAYVHTYVHVSRNSHCGSLDHVLCEEDIPPSPPIASTAQ